MKILEKYSRKKLLRQASKVSRKVVMCSPDQAKKVGILWHESNIQAFNYLQDYFKNKSVIVRHLCYSEANLVAGSNTITKKDTNWLGFPRGGQVNTFISYEFDLLLNICIQPCFPLEAITAFSVASFKTGWDFSNSGFYDLSVDVSNRPDSFYLAEQQIYYLQSFKK